MKKGYIYMLMNKNRRVLYTGVTNDLIRRIYEHKQKLISGFTERYNVCDLMYFEEFPSIEDAIAREKQIKSWNRHKKLALIKIANPAYKDLYQTII